MHLFVERSTTCIECVPNLAGYAIELGLKSLRVLTSYVIGYFAKFSFQFLA